ncbi:MAG: eukaryotic-like serine/threonine-protein kinase [Verrucomicrobiota bacterium]
MTGMNVCGLTDSLANVIREPIECRQCGGVSRLANGLCLVCLMRTGLAGRDEGDQESFESILAKIDIHDSEWRIGPYEILEEIARGGMGVIYRARQPFSRRIVALKRVLSYHSASAETLARFRREAEAASVLDHPNILPIYEVGESEDGLPFFAMKFAPGGSLREVGPALRRSPERIVPLMLQVVHAVESAHARGLLHRDLKPGNILLDGRGEPLVSDFGLAKWLDASNDLTQTLTIFGTPGYIAPEQARGPASRVGPAADIYSLGAILFDLLAGRPPFLGEHAFAVLTQAMAQPAPRLRSVAPAVDRDLETICAHCLERDPSARYASAGDLARDLECWTKGKSISARPISAPARVWRWAKRNPALAIIGVMCLLLAALSWTKLSENRQFHTALRTDTASQHSLMILPFLDLDTGLPDDGAAGDIANVIRTQWSKIGPSRVVQAETSDLIFAGAPREEEIAGAARQAQVRAVLTGTKRQVDGRPIFSMHVIDPTRPGVLLSSPLGLASDANHFKDFFRSNATQFYRAIGAPPRDAASASKQGQSASDLIAAGKALMDRRTPADCDRAIECFEKATMAAPSSAQAYAFLAISKIGRAAMGGKPELRQMAELAANKAVELDPQSGETHRALSAVLEQKGDFARAREEVLRAIELNGVAERSAGRVASISKTLGRPDIALRWHQIMKHLQAQPGVNEFVIGDCWADLCEDNRAEQAYRETIALRPELPEGWIGICHLKLLEGDFRAAERICSENEKDFPQFDVPSQMAAQLHFFARQFGKARRIYSDLAKKDPEGGTNFYGAISYQSALGWLHLAAGDKGTGETILNRALQRELAELAMAPQHPEILYRTAAIEASLGRQKPALEHLRSAALEGWIDFRSLNLDPRFDALRADPAFKEISESMTTKVASLRRPMPADLSGKRKVQ